MWQQPIYDRTKADVSAGADKCYINAALLNRLEGKARRAIPARRGLLAILARLAPRVILARRVSAVSRGRKARRGLLERTAYRLMMRR